MTALAPAAPTALGSALLRHLDEQLQSARRLLDHVLRQGQAVRRRDVDAVLSALTDVQGEMERRGRMEQERTTLLTQAGALLGLPAHTVTLDAMATVLAPMEAQAATSRSAELRGLLSEIAREHQVNRALMKQELAFLDHLTRLIGNGGEETPQAYGRGGERPGMRPSMGAPMTQRTGSALRALDLQA